MLSEKNKRKNIPGPRAKLNPSYETHRRLHCPDLGLFKQPRFKPPRRLVGHIWGVPNGVIASDEHGWSVQGLQGWPGVPPSSPTHTQSMTLFTPPLHVDCFRNVRRFFLPGCYSDGVACFLIARS